MSAVVQVTNALDSGTGSLRAAIAAVAPNGTIQINPSVTSPIVIATPIIIDKSLTIVSYVNNVISNSPTFTGGDYVIEISNGANASFEGIVFQGTGLADVGAMRASSTMPTSMATITMRSCVVDGWSSPAGTSGTSASVMAYFSHADIQNTSFTNNTPQGGVLSVYSNVTDFGGSFVNENINCNVDGCMFENSSGLMTLAFRTTTLTAILGANGNLTVNNTTFRSNTNNSSNMIFSVCSYQNSSIVFTNCLFEDNDKITSFAGGETVTIDNCIFRENIVINSSDVLSLNNITTCQVTNCIFDSNTITHHALHIALQNTTANSLVQNCTLTNNTMTGSIENASAVFVTIANTATHPLTFENCTIDSNTYQTGAGGMFIGGTSTSNVILRNTTITNNVGPQAGGIYIVPESTINLILFNTLVANNYITEDRSISLDINGTIFGNSFNNLIGVNTSLTGITNGINGNIIGTAAAPIDPLIGSIGDYGGDNGVPVVPLLEGSPAIDAGSNAYVQSTYDERGAPYLRIYSATGPATVDIGAFEFQPFIPPCYLGESVLRIRELATGEIKHIQAKDIYALEHEVYDMDSDYFIPIKYNAVIRGADVVYKIAKDLLGEDKPSQDLFITSGHPIQIDGKAVKARDVPGAERTEINKSNIYSIVCSKWTPIDVNGLPVYAWSEHKWFRHVKKEGIVWVNNLRKVD